MGKDISYEGSDGMYQLIRASAGTGKTFRLSGHFLQQLFLGNTSESILATTFTRKAAGEILERVLLRLARAASDSKECELLSDFLHPAMVTQDRALQLLAEVTQHLHRIKVCTLDSFFQQMARSLTLELGLPPGWSIMDDHLDQDLRQQAIDAVLSQQVAKDAQRLMHMLAKGRSKRSVRDLIDDTISSFYELFLLTNTEAWHQIQGTQRLTNDQIQQAIRDLFACDVPSDKRAIKARREDVDRFQAGQWESFITKGLASKVFDGSCRYYGKPLSEDLVETYQQLLTHAKAEVLHLIGQQTQATYHLLSRFDREYTRLRQEHGWMRFSDVTRRLARSVEAEDGHRLSYRLDSAIRHLLLDEFQDTSPDQWGILKRLTTAIVNDQQQTGSVFCVGDPKQAIYGWRGGVAEILDAVEATLPNTRPETLDISRRSCGAVIETVNRVFQHICQHDNLEDYGAACFTWSDAFPQHKTVHTELPGYAVFRTSPGFEGDSKEEKRIPYFRWIAQQIQLLHQSAPGVEIGVLTRKNSTVARLVHELTLLGVEASEEGGTPPDDSPAVLAVCSLLHLASHPGCQVSRFHVANSPLADLLGLHDWHDAETASRVAEDFRGRLLDDGYGRTLQWISQNVRPHCNQRDLIRLQQVVAAGWKFDQAPSLNPADFVRLLQDSRMTRSESAPVRVMTVHQSKGLEFDIVVLPELDTDIFRTPAAAVGGLGAGTLPDRVSVWRNKQVRTLLPERMQQAFQETVNRDVYESLCLMYVAMTRAAHALHMFSLPLTNKSVPRSYAGLLLASLSDERSAGEDEIVYQTGDEFWFNSVEGATTPARPFDTSRQPGQQRPQVHLAALTGGRRRGLRREAPSTHDERRLSFVRRESTRPQSEAGPQPDTGPQLDPRLRGTLIHGWFETIEWLDSNSTVDRQKLQQVASIHPVSETVVESLLDEFTHMIQQPQTHQALARDAAASAPAFAKFAPQIADGSLTLVVENERPFVRRRGDAIVQGFIDRLVLLKDGSSVVAADIVDFKTDRAGDDVSAWVEDRVAYYREQLNEYREAVSYCFRVPLQSVSTRLVLLDVDQVIAVTHD
jgi:ATP-dependent exoDNAse (exonuclease V) beta subunit